MVKAQKCYCRTNWAIRNNSSNIAAVLNPTKFYSGHNRCYCNEKQVRPQLFSRPKKCIFDDSEDEDVIVKRLPINRLSIGNAYRVSKSSHDREDLTVEGQVSNTEDALDDTTGKSLYKSSTNVESDYSSSSLSRSRYLERVESEELEKEDRLEESSIKPSVPLQRKISTSSENEKKERSIKELSDFRKDHYFDTHSTDDLMKTIPEHRCVHRFSLDDRFLPLPLNTDVYGESRCIICGKPMENKPNNTTDERFIKKKKTIFPKFYKYGLAPRKIFVGDDDVKVEMILNEDKVDNWKCQMKKPEYFNTYALRYQKGVKS